MDGTAETDATPTGDTPSAGVAAGAADAGGSARPDARPTERDA